MFGAATVESTWFTSLTPDIVANIGVIIPVALGIMALMIGVGLIPKLIRRIGRV